METSPIPVVTAQTTPFDDQRPGTNGLRRKTAVFEGKKNYLQNYIQSVLSSIDLRDRQGCTMVVGSDGRYFSRAATEVIVQMAAANGVIRRIMYAKEMFLLMVGIDDDHDDDQCKGTDMVFENKIIIVSIDLSCLS